MNNEVVCMRNAEGNGDASNFVIDLCMQKSRYTISTIIRSVWSRGMIPPSGGGGREFESRNGPLRVLFFASS